MANNRFTDYIIPTAVDIPPIRALFAEAPYAYGPGGAKGIGELPMDGPAPAIGNAIVDALGLAADAAARVATRVPFSPERLFAELVEVAHG
jgi:CO/xanthine dehydrogenase Mo-binding subunit